MPLPLLSGCCPLPHHSPSRPPWMAGGWGAGAMDGWLLLMGCCEMGLQALNAEGLCVRWLKSKGDPASPKHGPEGSGDGCQTGTNLCRTKQRTWGRRAGNPSPNLWWSGAMPRTMDPVPPPPGREDLSPWGAGGCGGCGEGTAPAPRVWGRGEASPCTPVSSQGPSRPWGLATDGAKQRWHCPHL